MSESFIEIDYFIQKLKSTKSKERTNAIENLIKLNNTVALHPIISLKKDKTREVRYLVATALGEMNNPLSKKALFELMTDDSEKVRYRAAISLGKYSTKDIIPVLLTGLGDKDENVRYFSRKSLIKQGENVILDLINSLSSENWQIRKEASIGLGEIKGTAIDLLIEKTSSDNADLRYWATKALGNSASIKATTALIKMTVDKREEIQIAAIEALGKSDDSKAIYPLIKILESNNSILRYHAKEALIKIGDSALPQINKSLRSKIWHTRKTAAEIMGIIGGQAVELLLSELDNSDSDIVFWAIEALGNIGDKASTSQIVRFLKSKNRDHALASIRALGKLKDDRVLLTLISHLNNSDDEIMEELTSTIAVYGKKAMTHLIKNLSSENWLARKNSAKTLKKMGSIVLKSMVEILGTPDEDTAYWAAEILGEIGLKAENRLINFLEDSNHSIRFHAVKTLGKLKSEKAGETLLVLLYDEYWSIRKEAARALGEIKYLESVPSLIKSLKDEDEDLRSIVCEALGKIGDRRSLPFIHPLINDSFAEVRCSAIKTIAVLDGKKLINSIISKIDDENIKVRKEAVKALGFFEDSVAINSLIKCLKEEELKFDAIDALGHIDSSIAEKEIRTILENSKNKDERALCALSLSNFISSKAIDVLTKSLNDEYWVVRTNAATAISIISEKRLDNDRNKTIEVGYSKDVDEKYKMGINFLKGKKYSHAMLSFQRALSLNPDHYQSIVNLGIVYEKMGMFKDATKQFETAIGLKSKRPEAYLYLGIVLGIKKEFKEALIILKKGLSNTELTPNSNIRKIILKLIKNLEQNFI